MVNYVEAEITAGTDDGVQIPIKFTIEWPENMGYYAIPTLKHINENPDEFMDAIIQQLVANGDTSLLAHLPDDNTQGIDD